MKCEEWHVGENCTPLGLFAQLRTCRHRLMQKHEDVSRPLLVSTAVQGTDGGRHKFHWKAHWSLWLSTEEERPMLYKKKTGNKLLALSMYLSSASVLFTRCIG